MEAWRAIALHIEQSTGKTFSVKQCQSVSGGSINSAYMLLGSDGRKCYIKTNATGHKAMFEAEAKALEEIASCQCIKVPRPLCFGDDGVRSYIVLEFLELAGQADSYILGQQLAAMHRIHSRQFGWVVDNTIGITHQSNDMTDDWLVFWCEHRLGFQLRLASENGYDSRLQLLGERLLLDLPKLFTGREVLPSMLHGDLWGGNVSALKDGTPVIFDPAMYFGDREADIAMTSLFGGFTAEFYSCYQDVFPLDDGFAVRKTFYNIYHILNHLNIFGAGYYDRAITMMEQVLAEIN